MPPSDPLLLSETSVKSAAEEMIAEYGNEALTKADERVKALQREGFDSVAKTWDLIREVIKDLQESDDPMDGYKNALNKGVFLSE